MATLLSIHHKYPESIIRPMTASIYPVSFRAVFLESEVPFDFALRVSDTIEDTVFEVFAVRVPVLAYSNFESRPRAGSKIWVSILIELPGWDERVTETIIQGVAKGLEGWQCLSPRADECHGTFWLRWHEDPMGM